MAFTPPILLLPEEEASENELALLQMILSLRRFLVGQNAPLAGFGSGIFGQDLSVLVDGVAPTVPVGLVLATGTTIDPVDGVVKPFLDISWTANTEVDMFGYEVQYRQQGVTFQTVRFILRPGVSTREHGVIGNVTYEVKIQAIDTAGNRSGFTSISTILSARDTVAPASPTAVVITPGFQLNVVRWTPPPDVDWDVVEIWRSLTNDSATAAKVGEHRGIMFVDDKLANATQYFYWLKVRDKSGNVSGFHATQFAGVSGTTLLVATADVGDSQITTTKLIDGVVTTVKLGDSQVTTQKMADGSVTTVKIGDAQVITQKIADGAIVTIKVGDSQITVTKLADGSVTKIKFGSGLQPVQVVASLPTQPVAQGETVFLTTDNKLYRSTGSAWTVAVPTVDLTGQVTSGQITDAAVLAAKIADGAVTLAKHASGLRPVEIGAVLPTQPYPEGATFFLTTDDKLYRSTGAAWTLAVPTVDLTGQITTAQITDLAITTAKIAGLAVDSAKLADGSITTTKLGDSQVTTAKITALAVDGTKIADGAISTTKIGDAQVTTIKIGDGQVTTIKIGDAQIIASKLADGSVTKVKFGAGLQPVQVVASLPVQPIPQGETVFLTTDNKLYRSTGSAWTVAVPTVDLTGQITETQITDGAVLAAKIADSAVTLAKHASGLRPVEIGSALPAQPYTQGAAFFLTTDNKLYRSTGSAWTLAVPTADLTGQITESQIANDAVTALKIAAGAVGNTELAALAVDAAKLATDAVTETKIAANAVVAAKIAALAVVAGKIAASAVNTAELAAGAVTAAKIAAGTITAAEIATDTIVAGNIAAGAIGTSELAALSVVAGKIAANAITATEIAALAVVAGKIAAGAVNTTELAASAVTAAKIAAGTITSNEIAADTITAGNIAAGAVTASELAALAVIAGKIAAGAVATAELAAGAVTAAKIAAGTITSNEIAADTILAGNIAAGAITSSELAALSVIAGKIAAGAVTATELAALSVVAGKIAAGAVNTSELAAGAVTAAKIAAATITAAEIAADTITAGQIAAGAIATSELAALAVTTAKIAAGAVTAGELASASVTAAKIAAGIIDSGHLRTDVAVITVAAQIANAIINNAHISDLSADKITAGLVDVLIRLGVNNIELDGVNSVITIKDTQATPVTRIQIGKLGAGTTDWGIQIFDSAGTLMWSFTSGVQTAGIAASAVTTGKIADANITTPKIADSNITTPKVAANAITQSGSSVNNAESVLIDGNDDRSVAITTQGGPVDIRAGLTMNNYQSGNRRLGIDLKRGTTLLTSRSATNGPNLGIAQYTAIELNYIDTPVAGTYTYKFTVRNFTDPAVNFKVLDRSLSLAELKR